MAEEVLNHVRAQIRRPMLQRVFDYWNARRDVRDFPSRDDLDVTRLGFAFGNLLLIDVLHDPVRFRYRLFGTVAAQHWGYEMTGKMLDELPGPERRAFIRRNYTWIVENRQPMTIHGTRIFDGRNWVFDSVMMPLGVAGTINMILVCVEYTTS